MTSSWSRSGPWFGVGGMVVVAWLYGASVLLLPAWVVAILCVCWLLLFAVTLRCFTSRPYVAFATPLVAALVWVVAVLVAGS